MSADPDRALLATSLAFAGAAVVGSAVAIREDLPGQPCGISVPLSVPAGLLVGWGAGVAAPWPMPATAVIAAARSQRTRATRADRRRLRRDRHRLRPGHRHRTRHPPAALVVGGDQARDCLQHRGVGGPHHDRVAPSGGCEGLTTEGPGKPAAP